jgi:hypothetical protein
MRSCTGRTGHVRAASAGNGHIWPFCTLPEPSPVYCQFPPVPAINARTLPLKAHTREVQHLGRGGTKAERLCNTRRPLRPPVDPALTLGRASQSLPVGKAAHRVDHTSVALDSRTGAPREPIGPDNEQGAAIVPLLVVFGRRIASNLICAALRS